jgi:uncharacterized membrane protein YcfT
MLAAFSLATKLLFELRAPHWGVLAVGALMQMSPVATGATLVDYFAEYFVYFYAGYALAPHIFRIVDWAQRHVALSVAALLAYAVVNGVLVFTGGFDMQPVHAQMGYAALPGLHLALAFTGSLALCIAAALLMKLPFMDWLRWLGAHSIVVYLSFSIPMAATRVVLLKVGIGDTSILSTVVMLSALLSPLALYWAIRKTGFGKFLFERPAWAHIPGTPGSRSYESKRAIATPAE